MLAEAEKYKEEDEAEAARIQAKNGLESYAYSLRNTLSDEKVDEKLEAADKDKLKKAIDSTVEWLDNNTTANKVGFTCYSLVFACSLTSIQDEFEAQQKELEGIANPIMMKFYQGQGGAPPGGMPGAGGFPGAGAPPSGGDDGPQVEEVD